MPKLKSKSGAKKRFRLTGTGKVVMNQAGMRHMLRRRSKSMKRKARGTTIMGAADSRIIKRNFLPYA
ncbi:50S ribosomal protein L35 [Pelagibius sp. Alg239-R121]|uniref:50S ribosomal protein L35 n=1 Tax=Pelagibius sp. Alg239-R121 TaxID=2993448 RepID=UPI0024A704FC|nr:50S ribosomal protein L35 [Pelagibius sp. Alg239-R121]